MAFAWEDDKSPGAAPAGTAPGDDILIDAICSEEQLVQQSQNIAGQTEKADQTAVQEGDVNVEPGQGCEQIRQRQQDAAGQRINADLPEPANGRGDQLDEQKDRSGGDDNANNFFNNINCYLLSFLF